MRSDSEDPVEIHIYVNIGFQSISAREAFALNAVHERVVRPLCVD